VIACRVVDETDIRVGGKWRSLRRAIDGEEEQDLIRWIKSPTNGPPLGTFLRNDLPGSGWSTSG
jgi:transposase-like protein